MSMKIVVLGGHGNFGGRICRALAGNPDIECIAAGRTERAGSGTAVLDLNAPDFDAKLAALHPNLIIHCAGPFQAQEDYGVAHAACDIGAHYIDLADARDFVAGFTKAIDERAQNAGICAITGASSVPGLSSAVVDRLAQDFEKLDAIQIAIAPGQQVPRGLATLQSTFDYAGSPIFYWRQGHWERGHGWQNMRVLHFRGLGTRWAAMCDVPDLALFPLRYKKQGIQTVEFRAALELKSQHAVLWGLAMLRRLGFPFSLARHAEALDRLSGKLLDRYGSPNGGMMVRVSGTRPGGQRGHSVWRLLAPDGNGPQIPCMAALLLTDKLVKGTLTERGAIPCMGLLTLDDFAPHFAKWRMRTAIDVDGNRIKS